jgi:hypothetical protein
MEVCDHELFHELEQGGGILAWDIQQTKSLYKFWRQIQTDFLQKCLHYWIWSHYVSVMFLSPYDYKNRKLFLYYPSQRKGRIVGRLCW